jgi:hypothetical protein
MGKAAERATLGAPREAGQHGSWEAHALNCRKAQNSSGATGEMGAGQGATGEESSLELQSDANAAASPAALFAFDANWSTSPIVLDVPGSLLPDRPNRALPNLTNLILHHGRHRTRQESATAVQL